MKTPILAMVATALLASLVYAEPPQATAEAPKYKCLFNHELLIICGKKENSPQYIGSYIDKLADTDVDAIMCCPTMWRTNLFPSEVDPGWKKYSPSQPLSKFPSYDYIMRYLHTGGDPVRDTFEACRRAKKAFFISYRMNDQHYVADKQWPTHHALWREHPEYWLGDTDTSPYTLKDNTRVLNYAVPQVREYYYAIIEELCQRYDVDGVELDFQRFPKFFHDAETAEGTKIMTDLVRRIRAMLDALGAKRGKRLGLGVRVPERLAKCQAAGLDVPGWAAAGLIDMINVSSSYIHTIELGIEEFKAQAHRARVYGEMNYVLYQTPKNKFGRRYTTPEIYRASALNLLSRGADGLSLFNYDYVPEKQRVPMAAALKRITDVEYLRTVDKDYPVYRGFGSLPATNEASIRLAIPDDARQFRRAMLRVEIKEDVKSRDFEVRLNGQPLAAVPHEGVELFTPLAQNDGYATAEQVRFFAVPLDRLVRGLNTIELKNTDRKKGSVHFHSLELGLYRSAEPGGKGK